MHLLIYSVPYFPCKLYIGWVNENACDSTYVYVQSNHVNCKQFLQSCKINWLIENYQMQSDISLFLNVMKMWIYVSGLWNFITHAGPKFSNTCHI